MKKIYFTVTAMFNYGNDFVESGMEVTLVKEPENEYDKEAIRVEIEGLGKIGYVANSVRTVVGESYSAGRIYDKIGDRCTGTVMYKLDGGVLGYIEMAEEEGAGKY